MLPLLIAICALPQNPSQEIVRRFQNPPASAKPHTWWHWMDGNITKEGITADLEAMKQAGIGGAHIFDVGQGIPAGPVVYNSPEWRSLFAHAIHEASRLGLEMTVHNCAGWSSSGGPWVEPKDAMKKVVWSVAEFNPSEMSRMAQPLAKPQADARFYRDIAIYVFPTPARRNGAARGLAELTGMGPNPGSSQQLNWPVVASKSIIELHPERLKEDGTLNYSFPAGKWTILRLGYTLTGAQNVASRENGRGLEVDKLSGDSFNAYFEGGPRKYLEPLFPPFSPRPESSKSLTTMLVDSYETGYNNWTGAIRERFETEIGYRPNGYLPALAGYAIDDEKTTLGFLYDWRKNIAQLWTQNYSSIFANRLKMYGMQLAIEPYGNGNFDPFSYAKPAGLIMGEYWVGDSQINPSVKHASSVAHVYGHSVVGAEALTAMPSIAGWRNQPRQWKPFADQAMTLGINRVIYHRFAHQPWVSGVVPGMTMGPWGSHVDRTNTIWPYMPAWNRYLSRCQYLLQQGTFVADVLLFTGDDSPQSYAGEGQDLPKVPEGYDFDYCGVDPLMSLKVKGGRLVLPSGGSYEVLALPNTTSMTVRVLRKIKELVDAGARVVGPKPTHSPSLLESGLPTDFRRLAEELWAVPRSFPGGKARNYVGSYAYFRDYHRVRDFESAANGVRAIHRRIGKDEVYFVASAEPYGRTVDCKFRLDPAKPLPRVQLWHPESGKIEDAPIWQVLSRNRVQVTIPFEADGSLFVVLRAGSRQANHLIEVQAKTGRPAHMPPALHIRQAVYGDFASGKTVDVTNILEKAAGPYSLRFGATNANLGGDPALNIVKTLRVTYALGQAVNTVSVAENETLRIGDVPSAMTPPVYEVAGDKLLVWQPANFFLRWSNGRNQTVVVNEVPSTPVTGRWSASFPPGWDAPSQVTFDPLASWTEHPDFGVQHFSGTVTYKKDLAVSRDQLGTDRRLILDLGDVREMCRVRLNGKLLATLYKPPFRVDISDTARVGVNALEVDVTNLWVNRLIGDEQFPDDMGWRGEQLSKWPDWFVKHEPRPEPRRKTFTTWRHNTKDTPLMPSGLLGPVLLRQVKVVPLK